MRFCFQYARLCTLVLFFILSGCNNERFSNIQSKDIEVDMVRFEKSLFNLDIYNISDSIETLRKKYPEFLPLFSHKIINIGDPSMEYFEERLLSFITDQAVYNIYKRVSSVYPDFKSQKQKIEEAMGRWSSIFPEKNIPEIYTYISGFNQSIVTTENILGISIEKYLGTNEALYSQVYPPIPSYIRYGMTPEKLPSDVMRAWITTELSYSPQQDNLISQMIFNGQVMYATQKLLPEIHDTILWGFTPEQMKFCLSNEKQMWTYLVEQKLLFNTDNFRINQFTGDAPFTKDFSQDSPGKAAIWIGYRIVEQYANRNKNLSLKEIITEENYHQLLNHSKYRP